MKITLSSLALLFVLVSFDFVHASDVTGVYAIIDRVVLEPDEKDPQRVQIWGAFALAKGRRGQEYREPVRGYLYCSMTEGEEETCRAEWADLKKLAGTGKVIAFGSRYAWKAEVRKPTAKVEKPDPYSTSLGPDFGIRTVRGNTTYAPIRNVLQARAALCGRIEPRQAFSEQEVPMRPTQRFTVVFLIVASQAAWAADRCPDEVSARSPSPREKALYGDWEVKLGVDGTPRTALLSFSRDSGGNPRGQWIGSRGLSELRDIQCEGDRLSFTREGRNRNGRSTTWKFRGKIKDGKLSGTVSGDGADHTVAGQRIPPMPDVVGNWAMNYIGDRVASWLAVRVNREGELTAEWRYDEGALPITDFAYKEGKVTFTMKGASGDCQGEMTYEGSLRKANTLDGVFTSDRGKTPVAAFRMGTPIIGTWNLEVASGRGSRKQRLKVHPDMSGRYGAVPITRVHLEGDNPHRRSQERRAVTFRAVMKFGERTVEMRFAGEVADSKLTGEITTSRGRAKVTGKRAVPGDE